ncbi:hypothetical protein ACFWYW_28400 [Nonomuraea sp. NPDC059023]|uniref:hypothetical protein n=1 Tax=unclassified Nonomuraea TaxID=2593643 RepID=UPI0036934A12
MDLECHHALDPFRCSECLHEFCGRVPDVQVCFQASLFGSDAFVFGASGFDVIDEVGKPLPPHRGKGFVLEMTDGIDG